MRVAGRIGLMLSVSCIAGGSARGASRAPSPQWSSPIPVAKGGQCAVAAGVGDRIHFISKRYVMIGRDGRKIVTENVSDERQGGLDFPPAIAAGPDGAVHVVTRHGGDYNSGHEIRYRRRSPAGQWDLDLLVSKPSARNYTVGAAVTDDGKVYLVHSIHPPKENMNSYVECYEVVDGAVKPLGRVPGKRYFRADDGFRFCAAGRFLHLATGNPWPRGKAFYFVGVAGRGLPERKGAHREGSGRRGSAWLYPDGKGFVHFTYGAAETAWYNKYTYDGRKVLPKDIQLGEGLGKWHLSVGLAVVAASEDGRNVLAVLLRTDGSKEIADATLLWRWSADGGIRWNKVQETTFHTHGGEGRRRPALVAIGNRFFLFFYSGRGFQMSILDLPGRATAKSRSRSRTRARKTSGKGFRIVGGQVIRRASKPKPAAPGDNPEARKLFKQAEQFFVMGQRDTARQLFGTLIERFPDTRYIAKAREYLARMK